MKLLKTIKKLVEEAEYNLEVAIQSSKNHKEIIDLEKKLEDSMKLLSLYESIENKKED
jgi:DNA-binding transcriptional regulator LsrR (DeoR family)